MVLRIFLANSADLHVFRIVSPRQQRFDARILVDDHALWCLSVNGHPLRAGRSCAGRSNQPTGMLLDYLSGSGEILICVTIGIADVDFTDQIRWWPCLRMEGFIC